MKASTGRVVTLPDLLAGLQLEYYLVDDLVFKCNKAVSTGDVKPINPTIAVDFDVQENKEDKNLFRLEMLVDLNAGQELKKFDSHQIHLHLFGWFRFTANFDQPTKAKMMATNASSILYGIARTIVANLTGSFGAERYTLPTLNLLAVVKAKASSKPQLAKTSATASKS